MLGMYSLPDSSDKWKVDRRRLNTAFSHLQQTIFQGRIQEEREAELIAACHEQFWKA